VVSRHGDEIGSAKIVVRNPIIHGKSKFVGDKDMIDRFLII
jgi:hypothetical protein